MGMIEAVISEIEDAGNALDDAQRALDEAMRVAARAQEESEIAASSHDDDARQAAIEAISQIRRGASTDAILTLERHFLPKWADADAAHRAYRETMETH